MTFYLATTRFNYTTYEENQTFRANSKIPVIYGCNIRVSSKCPYDSNIAVIEMNNNTNRIEGIGLIKNKIYFDKSYRIYAMRDYNRFIYKGNYWLSCQDIEDIAPYLIEVLENILFKKRSHMKRLSGISIITDKFTNKWKVPLPNLKKVIRQLFAAAICKKIITGNFNIKYKTILD